MRRGSRNRRLLLLTACLGLAGCGGGGGQSSHPAPRRAVTGAVPGQYQSVLSALRRNGPVAIMPLGDSITFGAGDPAGNGYRLRLWDDLTGAGFPLQFLGSQSSGSGALPDLHNEGHGGYRIDQIADGVDGWLRDTQPEVILLMIGTNDVPGDQLPAAPGRLTALIDRIVRDDPQVYLLVASIPPRTQTDQDYASQVGFFNSAIPGIVRAEAAAGKPVSYVDIHSVLTSSDLADGIHPNPQGYAKMGDAWFQALQNL